MGYDLHLGIPVRPDERSPEMQHGRVLEIDEVNQRLTVECGDGHRDIIDTRVVLGAA